MRLLVQIPCFNEEDNLATVIREIPSEIVGVSSIKIIVVDDGSEDMTREVALNEGVYRVVAHRGNRGLAAAFFTALNASLSLHADIIVNIDGDNQYRSGDIIRLINPILSGEADVVIGDRNPSRDRKNSFVKRMLYRSGAKFFSLLAGRRLTDPVSGFRAYSRKAAIETHVTSSFSYTVETLFRSLAKGHAVSFVPIETNIVERPSRLYRTAFEFIARSTATAARVAFMHRPLVVLLWLASPFASVGLFFLARYLVFAAGGDTSGHVQSLVLASVLVVIAAQLIAAAFTADLANQNRKLLEQYIEQSSQHRGDLTLLSQTSGFGPSEAKSGLEIDSFTATPSFK
ncbi:glycosyltransferase family 2 protein [Roseiconus lacunae]|uniref:glycosyltransferase family 2 protein n=1 Tax=Roseiconus lacunae TaxID=2605694 RepID=UPI00308B9DFE|nr:glycosyltransferase family 2 protein [Stieleria sp. HD01]